jgi:hypothetical protein
VVTLFRGRIRIKGVNGVGVAVPEQNCWPSVWGTARVRAEGEIRSMCLARLSCQS